MMVISFQFTGLTIPITIENNLAILKHKILDNKTFIHKPIQSNLTSQTVH